MRLARAGLLGIASLSLMGADGGCSPDREVAVTVVRAGATCGGEAPGPSVRRLASQAELIAAFPAALGGAPAPAVDFEAAAVLLVSAGQRPTAGHAVELAAPKAPVKGGVALVQVALRAPPADAMTAQVVTSPCLVVSLPRAGLGEVKVAEGERALLGSVTLR
ncbi:MAG: protease complex subunit PrcB family protein [Anaeromyxobacter sp.]|nr:protease complex subunit PrcB family protein [Anaeromyxobacter sp.]MBL0277148.1 protease complex subunit PrcB family protein [Anaeromyxobacter sp.]